MVQKFGFSYSGNINNKKVLFIHVLVQPDEADLDIDVDLNFLGDVQSSSDVE